MVEYLTDLREYGALKARIAELENQQSILEKKLISLAKDTRMRKATWLAEIKLAGYLKMSFKNIGTVCHLSESRVRAISSKLIKAG